MVVFNCNACGEALKKNQVEKHYQQQCRRCEVLSCVDCGKEFWGNDYEKHTKCISEEEKYSGKNFKPKPNANKGEQKQELWTQQVQSAVAKVTTNPKLKAILQQLVDFPNIPRKKAKFENFLKNSFRVYDGKLAAAAWDAISAELEKQKPVATEDDQSAAASTNQSSEQNSSSEAANTRKVEAENGHKKSKKDKSGKKKKNKHAETGDVETEVTRSSGEKVNGTCTESDSHKGKKRKRKLEERSEDDDGDNSTDVPDKKHKSNPEAGCNAADVNDDSLSEDFPAMDSKPSGSFKWEAAIVGVLKRAPDNRLKVKKLRKKVLAEFNERRGDGKFYTEEKLLAKFTQKLANSAKLKLTKDCVQLVR